MRLKNPAWLRWKRDYAKDRGVLLYRPSQCTVCRSCVRVHECSLQTTFVLCLALRWALLISSDSAFFPQKPHTNLTDVPLLMASKQTGTLISQNVEIICKILHQKRWQGIKHSKKNILCTIVLKENVSSKKWGFSSLFLNWQEVFLVKHGSLFEDQFGIAFKKSILYRNCQKSIICQYHWGCH